METVRRLMALLWSEIAPLVQVVLSTEFRLRANFAHVSQCWCVFGTKFRNMQFLERQH